MNEISVIAMLTAFAAGIVSFLSPCVLPLVPGYVSYMAGYSLREVQNPADVRAKIAMLAASFFFVLGFSTVFVALGASVTVLGRLLLKYRYEANIIGGAIVVVFGVLTTGLVKILWFQRDFRLHPHVRSGQPLAAYLLGLAFGFGWTPCIGPVLGAILTVSAVAASASNGIALLGGLFAWPGDSIFVDRRVHGCVHETTEVDGSRRTLSSDRRRRRDDNYGRRHDDGAALGFRAVAA